MALKYKIIDDLTLTKLITLEDLQIKENLNSRCFMCRELIDETNKTDEHVFPKWLQRKYNLWNQQLTLPNNQPFAYKNMLVPCCGTCNGGIMSVWENDIQIALNKGFDSFKQLDERIIAWWIYKIYYGLILKGTTLRYDIKDPKSHKIIETEFIEKNEGLYFYMEELIKGTDFSIKPYEIYLFRGKSDEIFDFLYSEITHTVLIKMGEVLIVMCLDSFSLFSDCYKKEIDVLNNLEFVELVQAAEIFAKINYFKSHFAFQSSNSIAISEKGVEIKTEILDIKQIKEFDFKELFGYLLLIYKHYGINANEKTYVEGKMISLILSDHNQDASK